MVLHRECTPEALPAQAWGAGVPGPGWGELQACLGCVSGGVGWAVLSGVLGAEMEEPAALGSLFQPLSWTLVHFLAEVCSATHPDPSFATSGNPEGPFSPQEPFGAWGSGSETSLLQPLLLLLLFCCKSCPDGNRGQPCPPPPVPMD